MNKLLSSQQKIMNRQSGFTLIELMVSATLGVILIGGMYTLFSVNKESMQVQHNVSVAQEKVNFVLQFIGDDVRRAGYPGFSAISGVSPFGDLADPTYPNFAVGPRFDTLVISYRGQSQVSPRKDPPYQPADFVQTVDCLGNAVPDGAFVEARYFVRPNANTGIQELVCQVVGGGTAPIIDHVEAFKVIYGIDTSAGPCVNIAVGTSAKDALAPCMAPNIYVDANGLVAAMGPTPLTTVKTVRIALAVSSEDTDVVDRATGLANSEFRLLGTNFQNGLNQSNFTEGRIIRYGIKTVALRQALRGP